MMPNGLGLIDYETVTTWVQRLYLRMLEGARLGDYMADVRGGQGMPKDAGCHNTWGRRDKSSDYR
jgi:hypothetical protein